MRKVKVENWELLFEDKKIPASVPGDITIDLRNAGIIEEPYYGKNHLDMEWIAGQDFTYRTTIMADEKLLSEESVRIIFEGIDLFSEIYINDKLIGKTENMFIAYEYEVKPYLKRGENILRVEMKSTTKAIEKGEDSSNYISVFNRKRFFVRKAQCHFGWDWAPDMPGYGIWGNVYLEVGSKYRIKDIHYKTTNDGDVTFFAETNYNLLNVYAPGSIISVKGEEKKEDKVIFYISEKPNGKPIIKKECDLQGSKCFINFKVEDFQLWWPAGYGNHPLYNYKIELIRDGKICHVKTGRFAFRTVKVLENPYGDNRLTHTLYINDKEVFMKGSNWVPMECFTGVVTYNQYEKFINRAVESNYNMLRIWGGGIYEKEDFYDICDEKGIMVWQDIALACSDIPEDKPEWVDNFLQEVEYNVKRLRVHPSLVYWSGGNERPGSFAREDSKGDFLINYTLPGLVNYLDNTRPYYRQSPCSYTDIGNDPTNGDCHWGNFERCITSGVKDYRSYISEMIAPLASECAILGPCSEESFKKFMPEDKLWPMNELWEDRLTENPSSLVKMNFAEREYFYAKEFYGEPKNLTDFIAKGMLVHAESIRAELEIMRAYKGFCSGFMNWMYNDIWPQATWSVIDYYGEPKQVFYQMKRSFQPIYATFYEDKNKATHFTLINDLHKPYNVDVRYGMKNFDGKILCEHTLLIKDLANNAIRIPVDFDCDRDDIYLYVEYDVIGNIYKTLYSPHFWMNVKFESDYDVEMVQINKKQVNVKIHANKFAKSVFVSHKDNFKFTYSDNYIDVEAGSKAEIIVTCDEEFDMKDLVVTDFAKQTR